MLKVISFSLYILFILFDLYYIILLRLFLVCSFKIYVERIYIVRFGGDNSGSLYLV